MRDRYEVIRRPCITEKATAGQEANNQVTMRVARQANKLEIKAAVEQLFKVQVTRVRTSNMPSKQKRVGRSVGTTSPWKKAVVTLAPGSKIDFLEGL
ncbi:MAG: 50S ribosomal protein L23 [Thermodesulfobacteriota bacterium]